MKVLLRVLLVIVIALVILGIGAYFYLDTLARHAITYATTTATGVDTTLDSAHVGVFAGELTMDNLQVANPTGFQGDKFLKLGHGDVQVTLSSLMDNTVVVPKLHLDALHLDLEYAGGKANFQVILDNLARMSKGSSTGATTTTPQPAPRSEEPGKGFKIQSARVTGITVDVHVASIAGQTKPVDQTLKIGDIDLGAIGTDTPNGVLLSRVTAIILQKVIQQVVNEQGGQLPTQILNGLKGGLGDIDLNKLGQGVGDLLGDTKGKDLKDAGKQVEQTSKAAGAAAKDVTKGLSNLLGGGKKDKDDKSDNGK